MKTLLVLTSDPGLAESLHAAVSPERHRVIQRISVGEAEPFLRPGMVDCCCVDVQGADVQAMWTIERLRRALPDTPLLVFTGPEGWKFEEEAYLKGVTYVLARPLRPRLVAALVDRCVAAASPAAPAPAAPVPSPASATAVPLRSLSGHSALETLGIMRDFSAVLTHSLCAEALLRQFLLLLREVIGVNRAAIFLRQPAALFGGTVAAPQARLLRSACAVGLPAGLLTHFELSFETGIGGALYRQGRILRRDSPEALTDVEIQKEFEVLGAQAAVPMLDRETLVGIAAFDGRVTGEPLTNAELELIFHLLEEVGLAVKNIWLHDQLAANHELLANVLRELSSACVVISRDLEVLHANQAARRHLITAGRRGATLEFSDLPPALSSKVYQVLKTGAGLATFKYSPEDQPGLLFHVTIVPFQRPASPGPDSALLVVEDQTQSEQLTRLEIEAANLRLIRIMADRLAHEVGNSLVPLSTHQQLIASRWRDPEFRASMETALADSVLRITRLTNQMRFLARDKVFATDSFPLAPLVEEAYQEAQKHQPVKSARLKCESASEQPIVLKADRAAIKHALAEALLNALQANPADANIAVSLRPASNGTGQKWVHIEVQDNGAGFTAEALQKVPAPFFTTRNVGLGLGLTVSRKIIESHHGKLEILPPRNGPAGLVRISLPLEAGAQPDR